ncbi:MAG: hypothetical protein WC634_01570 [archaeon]
MIVISICLFVVGTVQQGTTNLAVDNNAMSEETAKIINTDVPDPTLIYVIAALIATISGGIIVVKKPFG